MAIRSGSSSEVMKVRVSLKSESCTTIDFAVWSMPYIYSSLSPRANSSRDPLPMDRSSQPIAVRLSSNAVSCARVGALGRAIDDSKLDNQVGKMRMQVRKDLMQARLHLPSKAKISGTGSDNRQMHQLSVSPITLLHAA